MARRKGECNSLRCSNPTHPPPVHWHIPFSSRDFLETHSIFPRQTMKHTPCTARKTGFTLIELLVVIAIIAILA
ncbi:MAG: type II secretion system GspH family protein, partial [Armatimonadetes bacterium]|nr:type II secretion system GspH family protein [Armatimonadota bacterium]